MEIAKSPGTQRYAAIDLLRGLIMVFMALDHASAMIAKVHFSEMWGVDFETYPSFIWWLTRFVSHLCAPGFFFLMGMGITLFAVNRTEKGWSGKRIISYFVKRGLLILVMMVFFEFPSWVINDVFNQKNQTLQLMPGLSEGGMAFPTTVLYGLALCMIISAFFIRLGKTWLLAITFSSFLLSGWYLRGVEPIQAFSTWEHLLLIPGITDVMVLYPIIPWLGITSFGMFWAKLLIDKKEAIYKYSLYIGLIFIALFLVLRMLGYGNFQVTAYQDWISFFTVVKYPPGLTFFLITLGINLILFFALSKAKEGRITNIIRLYGQTAMFFYIFHLLVYALIGIAFPLGSSVVVMYLIWILGLIMLYPLCRWFLNFKQKKTANSMWRMI